MGNVSTDQLKRVIETQLGGIASFARSARVAPISRQASDWDGMVHLFDLKNHPQAKRAYAWSSSVRGGSRPRYFAVLHMGKVRSPAEAVKAVIAVIKSAK